MSGYRVSGRSPNWSAPTSARRISNANTTRVVLLEISQPVTRAFPPLLSFHLPPPLLLGFPRSSASLIPFFLFFSIRSPSGKKVETFPTFSLSPTRPRAPFYRKIPLRGLLWRTWARSRNANKTTVGDQASLVCPVRFYRFRRPHGMFFFLLTRFLFRLFLSNVHEEK